MDRWHVVECKSGVTDQNRAESNLISQSFEVYSPKAKFEQIRAGKKVEKVKPVFPGYLFVKFNPYEVCLSNINYSRGVKRLLCFGDTPAVVSDELVGALRLKYGREDQQINDLPKQGEKVTILSGPFHGLDAIYQEPDGEKRSMLLISLLGKTHSMSIDNKVISV